jgi:hypothetical protein
MNMHQLIVLAAADQMQQLNRRHGRSWMLLGKKLMNCYQQATAEAERITGNAWQALRHAMKSLEA